MPQSQSNKFKLSRKEDYLYVCLTGFPPFKREFEAIGIPGEQILIYPEGFDPEFNESQIKSRLELARI